jgi:ELMO domain-containing protein
MEKDRAGFFFAITAINIAFFMKKYFHLADFLLPGKDAADYCNRRALKNFCRLMVSREQAYEDLHEVFLRYFYTRLWVPAQRQNTETLLQFNSLFNHLTTLIKSIFEGLSLANYA